MGSSICADAKKDVASGPEHEQKVISRKNSKLEQEEVNNATEVDEKQFSESLLCLVQLAANGYPKALRSTYAKRNEVLRKHEGDQEKAVQEVKAARGQSLTAEVRDMLMSFIPYVGIPFAVVKPMWIELRRGCLIAAVYGHDLSQEETQARVLLTLGVAQGGERAAEKSLEAAIKIFWATMCNKCGMKLAKKLPVGKVVKFLDFEEKAKQALIAEFKQDQQPLGEEIYSEVLDERPSNRDLAELLKEKGEVALHNAKDQAVSWFNKYKDKAVGAMKKK